MSPPLAIDLYCGLGGWTDGLLAEGWDVVGFDLERHQYGDHAYPAQLVLQDVLTLHGAQFRDAALIVASPPCQEFSYMAMPWSIAKEKQRHIAAHPEEWLRLTALFDACFRIQAEACAAAGRHIPLIVENVRGAQKWVGRSRWNFGSFHLWGDVPALMPMTKPARKFPAHCGPDLWRDRQYAEDGSASAFHQESRASKNTGGSWFNVAHNTTSGHSRNPDGRKGKGSGAAWFDANHCVLSSKSSARKAASAMIAKIPLPLSSYIARTFKPQAEAA